MGPTYKDVKEISKVDSHMGLSGKICLKQDETPNAEVEQLIFHFEFTLWDVRFQARPGRRWEQAWAQDTQREEADIEACELSA